MRRLKVINEYSFGSLTSLEVEEDPLGRLQRQGGG
jgi:hypothetical protein